MCAAGKQALSFPCDLDTTALALTVCKCDEDAANSVMDEMLEYINSDGIIQVRHLLLLQKSPRLTPPYRLTSTTRAHVPTPSSA
jgi:hypothetical protein